MSTFNLADLFEITAAAVPERTAIVAGPMRRSYEELDDRASRFAALLEQQGVRAGERVAILSWNRIEWLEAMLGAFKARAAIVNLNYRYTRPELLQVLEDARPAVVVAEKDLLDLVAPLPSTVMVIGAELERALAAVDPGPPAEPRSGDDPYLLYTGGTTGMPKGVLWRAEDVFFAALGGGNPAGSPISRPKDLVDVLAPEPQPWLVTSPLMHGNGQWNSLLPLLTGRGVVLWTGRGFDAPAVAELASRERVQVLVLVGDGMALPFLDAVEDDDSIDLTSVATVVSGGAMLSPPVKRRLEERLPGCLVIDGFGASETGTGGTMVGGARDGDLPRFRMSPDCAVLDDDLRPVGPGEVGYLARRGRIPLGYWNDDAKTAASFPTDADGTRWAVLGDLARPEADGTVTLLGRGSTSINTGGEKVFPDEVVTAIKTHPSVADALVIGMPDERFGQRVVALLASTGPTTLDDDALRDHLRPMLAGYKLPRRVVPVDAIRYTAQGKPDLAWAKARAGGADR